jgi:ribosome modulation factor
MTHMDAFQAQQTLAYLQGRKAFAVGRSMGSNPYTFSSFKYEAWANGWLDAKR